MARRPKKLRAGVLDMHRGLAKERRRKQWRFDRDEARKQAQQIQRARALIRDTIRLETDYMPSFTVPGHVIRQEPQGETHVTLLDLEAAQKEEALLASLLLVGGRATPEAERDTFAKILKRLHDAIEGAKKIQAARP
jgi:hypothetical protein